MKIHITFKDPDTLHQCIEDGVRENMEVLKDALGVDEFEAAVQKRVEKVTELCTTSWFEWGEYLSVEVDTDENSARVMRIGE